jgi:hypothetical protein
MSTRGWYDYYVIDPGPGTLSLAMRFYKWGDATPENALGEYLRLKDRLHQHQDRLPVEWLDRLLREQLSDLHANLPRHFATAAFLFLLQRAAEEADRDRWHRHTSPEKRPGFPLSFALDERLEAEPFEIAPNPDPLLERVRRFIATARYLRPWRDYGLRLDLLHWLQYLTQPTRSTDMGSLAGDCQPPWDIDYQYRFFFWLDPRDPSRIGQIAIELCRRDGEDVLTTSHQTADPQEDACRREQSARLHRIVRESDIGLSNLAMLQHEYATAPDSFWRFREQPDRDETLRRARLKALRPSCDMLLHQIETRFGPEVAGESRAMMAQIDDFDALLHLAGPVLNSRDSDAWLGTLRDALAVPAK